MANRSLRTQFEPLEPRALLSHLILGTTTQSARSSNGKGAALVGSIQGTETGTPQGVQLEGTGTVTPLGNATVTGFFGGGKGALNNKGTMTFSNNQGSLALSLKTHGYFPLRSQNAEEIRVSVQTRSATGSFAGIHVAGTVNLVNKIFIVHEGEHPPVPFTAQINLKPTK